MNIWCEEMKRDSKTQKFFHLVNLGLIQITRQRKTGTQIDTEENPE